MHSQRKHNVPDFLSKGFRLPDVEEKVLKFWEEHNIFEKSLTEHRGKKPFVFYEGPPYANGKPGIHHVLARIVKDIILRYKSMRGYSVPRRAGWDTHGLPVEIAAEKALGLKSKKEIEKYGIKLFNQKAREAVWIYKDEWETLTRRIGYWLDLQNAYITYTSDYIETLWWTLKRIWSRKLLYKGHKVVPWCTRCGTALSSHELALGYEETTDQSVYVKFHLLPNQTFGGGKYTTKDRAYILSWTTTPWTLPGNVALAVGRGIDYSAIRVDGVKELLILASDLIERVFRSREVERVHNLKGEDLLGLKYEPLFNVKPLKTKSAYKIYAADFVSTDEGTGVVHTAVMYGEDDYELGKKVGLPQHHTVGEDGKFTKEVKGFAGLYVKAKETEAKIFKYLERNGNLLKIEPYTHEYPYCWRCETPVLYYGRSSWFIAMSRLRTKLLANNRKVNWMPAHLKEGRFGEWLKEVKDWNLSRERYWGAPLPIWECAKCGYREIIGGLDELSRRSGGAKNSYWAMRHGESESYLRGILDSGSQKLHLTLSGRVQAEASARTLREELARRGKRINIIFSSDTTRTRETAALVAPIVGARKVIFTKRLREVRWGALEGEYEKKYHRLFPTYESRFERGPEQGESLRDVRARLWGFVEELERRYRGKNILFISHEYPIWMMHHAALGWSETQAIAEKKKRGTDFINVGEISKLDLKVVPRNDTGEVDLHRPYTDTISFPCPKCRTKMLRVKEVADVWYDSGAMPFAQEHYPFEHKNLIDKRVVFPADYIAEGMDQTRGWFYTLLAVATAMGYGAPYKNVVSLGLINDKFGQKMSKSKGNIVDPREAIQKCGADAIRWYFYTVTPLGEPKNFDEVEILKTFRRFHLILYNSLVFCQTYARGEAMHQSQRIAQKNVLDQWVLARLRETIGAVTRHLDTYEIREAALLIEGFCDDVSRWYVRRSRRRFQKPASQKDFRAASQTLGYVLSETAKLVAPFTPFFAESLYGALAKGGDRRESVHLERWPKAKAAATDKRLLLGMEEVRRVASAALAKRNELGVRVRQPLATLKIKDQKLGIKNERMFLEILKGEVNVKSIVFDPRLHDEVEFDTRITAKLREEGLLRELLRIVQELRQKANLKPVDKIVLMAELPEGLARVVSRSEKLVKRDVNARVVQYKKSRKFDAELHTKVENSDIWIGVRRM